MKFKVNFRDVNIKILTVEIFIFFAVIVFSGYFINKHNPLGLKGSVNYFLIFLTVITLFYGIVAGLISLILSLPILLYFYSPFPTNFFLFNLLMVLVFGEFYFYWNRNVKKAEEKSEYVEEKFNELRKNFYFLKLSFDQIEKSYVTKQVTVRGMIQDIKKLFAYGEKPYSEMVTMLSQLFKIERASLFIKNKSGKKYEDVGDVGEPVKFELNDYLLEEAFREKTLTYLPSLLNKDENEHSEYLAVIPVFNLDNLDAVFLIKEIAFVEYNKENLLLIYLFIFYFFENLKNIKGLSQETKKFIELFDIDFLLEIERLHKIWEKFKIESSIVAFYLKDDKYSKDFYSIMEDKVRNLDMIEAVDNYKIAIVMLPFTPKSGCKSFVSRISRGIIDRFGETFYKDLRQEIFQIDKEPAELIENIVVKKK
ncbi:MAG: hypothetical protein EVJ48_04895 [Candidatus Acidulodesulfobacterium acidiphilum]|uniref:PelD GGDEF domain-containing protein n=1 Tax=Candidatus Acidulodesulfobacterium acidiphilum TaxID=2597224 RepID=A0A520XDJ3_9DELT|nr:MAG: hypothetical protein EVJ48_04895 [Candidatus Acidulodesulfobacterium acidiphilum]